MADRPHQPFQYDPEPLPWLPDRAPKEYHDYECPACGGIERVSSLVDRPLSHRHRYGADQLQTGMVMLRKVAR